MSTASAVPAAPARAVTPSAWPVKTMPSTCRPSREYIHHPIPVSKYDREALLDDVTAPETGVPQPSAGEPQHAGSPGWRQQQQPPPSAPQELRDWLLL